MSNQSSTTAASTPTVEEYEAQGFGARYRTLRDGRFGVVIQSGEDEALGLAKDEEVTVLVLKRDGTVNRERVKPIHAGEDFMLCGILQTLDRGAGGSANPASERQRKAIERMFARLDEHDPGTAQEIRTRHLDAVGSPEELSIQGASALLDALDQALGPPPKDAGKWRDAPASERQRTLVAQLREQVEEAGGEVPAPEIEIERMNGAQASRYIDELKEAREQSRGGTGHATRRQREAIEKMLIKAGQTPEGEAERERLRTAHPDPEGEGLTRAQASAWIEALREWLDRDRPES